MLSIKTKLNLFGILIVVFTLTLVTTSIAWVLAENNIAQSKIELKENMKIIQDELEYNKKRLLASSQKTAELQELDLKIKHITRNKNNYTQHIEPLYIQLAFATHDSANIAGNFWKTMIYDKEGELVSFSHIEKDYSKKGYVFAYPNPKFMVADGKTLADPLLNPWVEYPAYNGFEPYFDEKIPEKETIVYTKSDMKIILQSLYPIMGLNFDKKSRKMTPSSVGFVATQKPLDIRFADKIKRLVGTNEINIYSLDKNSLSLSVGTLEQKRKLTNRYLTYKKVVVSGVSYIQEVLHLYSSDKVIGAIVLLQEEKTIFHYIFELFKSLLVVFAIILLIIIPFTLLLIRNITNPIVNLQEGIKELSSGNLGKQLEVYSKDEIGELTISFNTMSKELAKTDKIKILNKELQKSEERFRTLFDIAPILLNSFDKNGKVILWNKECERTFGWSKEEIEAFENPIEKFYPDPKIQQKLIDSLFEKNHANYEQWNPKTKSGKTINTMWANVSLPDDETIHIGHNITQQKEDEKLIIKKTEQLQIAKQKLEDLNNSLEEKVKKEIEKSTKQQVVLMQQSKLVQMGEMIENIAHQWRQPLSQINSSVLLIDTSLMKNKVKDELIEDKLLEIESLTAYMSKTIDDFKNFFHPNKKKTIFEVKNAIEKSYDILKGTLKVYYIDVDINTPANLYCNSHLEELQQVLLTLLNNAIDALISTKIQNAKITIKISQKNKDVVMTIQDNAKGVDEQLMTKIFEPYFTTKHQSQGTGLGLYMAKMIIESGLGGTLDVANKLDGACFTICIPQGEV